jgi:hypothetical protein
LAFAMQSMVNVLLIGLEDTGVFEANVATKRASRDGHQGISHRNAHHENRHEHGHA